MGRLNGKAAFAIIFGAWLLVQVLQRAAAAVPILAPLVLPILVMYGVFVVFSWIATPLFNTLLRFHPFGQHLLDRWERWASNLIAPCIVLSMFGFVAGVAMSHFMVGVAAGWYWFSLSVLVAAVFQMESTRRRMMIGAAAVIVGSLPWIGVLQSYQATSFAPFSQMFTLYSYGLLGVQIGSQMINVRPQRV